MATSQFDGRLRRFAFRGTGGAMPVGSFTIAPLERLTVTMNMRGRLPEGRVLSRGTLSAIDLADDSNQTSTILSLAVARKLDDYRLTAEVKSVTDGHTYKITWLMYDNSTGIYKETLIAVAKEE